MMKEIINPERASWATYCKRPLIEQKDLTEIVQEIIDAIKAEGDKALKIFAQKYDKVDLQNLKVDDAEWEKSLSLVSLPLQQAIKAAKRNIEKFHEAQMVAEEKIEITNGVTCWRRNVGIETVGLYIPGGSAPLFSTILMLGIPAKIAKCQKIILCTPCDRSGEINPIILYTAKLVGIDTVYKIGGAQAIAAMAYGTETIPKVDKIFGPGNQYVTKAKQLVQQDGVSIDMPAGPSEVLIIADNSCYPAFVAADLLSQAEHGEDSQVVLLTNDGLAMQAIIEEVMKQLEQMPRKSIAQKALKNSYAILFDNLEDCFDFSNGYAPEHLILAIANANRNVNKIINAGSVFIGHYSCESAGDYASGTNHTLPTNGHARSYSGISLDSFIKKISFQEITREGIMTIGNVIETMAEAEGLIAHKNAVSIRLKSINND